MPRTTLARALLKELELGTVRKDEILAHLAASEGGAQPERHGQPAAMVRVEWCDPGSPAGPPHLQPAALARGTRAVQGEPVILKTVPLYRFDDPNRVDVIRIGRLPTQDVQILDRLVSREHGLIIMGDHVPLYCDYGTLRDDGRSGSLNGTWINGDGPIRDTIVNWLPNMVVMFGTAIKPPGMPSRYSTHVTYQLVGRESWSDN